MSHSGLLCLVLLLALAKDVLNEETCSFGSSSHGSCTTGTFQQSSTVPDEQVDAQAIRTGSCNFVAGTCGYRQGCRETLAAKWKYTKPGYMELKASISGGRGQTSALESPLLDISRPSCLTFRAAIFNPVRLTVLLTSLHRNCTLLRNRTRSIEKARTFQRELPVGVAKIVFQGFGGGDTAGFARISSVTICPGRCNDTDSSKFLLKMGDNFAYITCDWDVVHWKWRDDVGATVELGEHVATLTTPLIQAPPPRTFDCISFKYFFSNEGEASLTVSLVDTHGVALPLWSVSHNNDSKTGKFIPEKGQLSVASGAAFRMRFTIERNQTHGNFIVAVKNLVYSRGNISGCQFIPHDAKIIISPDPASNGGADVAAVAGGVTAAVVVVVVIAVVICGIIYWRKRRTQRNAVDSKRRPFVTRSITDMTETGRPPSSNYYSEAKDLPSAQSPRATDDDGYSFPKKTTSHNDVMTDNAGGNPYTVAGKGVQVKSSDDYNRLGLKGKDNAREIAAGNQTKPTPNEHSHIGSSAQNPRRVETADPDSSDYYNHLGLKGRLHAHQIAQRKERPNEYSRTGSNAQNPCLSGKTETCGKESDGNANSSTSAGRRDEPEKEYDEAGLVDESAQSEYSEVEVVSEYYEVEVVDESEPEVANKVPGTVSDYDRLGLAKGGNDAGKTGKATPQAYDHVGIANESDYDVAQRDRRNKTIDSDYNRLGGI